jgi:hypothetical protein
MADHLIAMARKLAEFDDQEWDRVSDVDQEVYIDQARWAFRGLESVSLATYTNEADGQVYTSMEDLMQDADAEDRCGIEVSFGLEYDRAVI